MADLVWPTDWRPSELRMKLATITATFSNPYSGARQVLERDGQRWVAKWTVPGADPARHRRIDAFVASMRGPARTVLVPFVQSEAARGSLAGAPVIASGSSGRTIKTSGWTPNATGVLLAGDMVQGSAGRAYIVTADVNANTFGAADISVEPRLREAPTVGAAIVTALVTVRMQLVSDDSFEIIVRAPRMTTYELEFVEDLSVPS